MNLSISAITSIENIQRKYKNIWRMASRKKKIAIVFYILSGLALMAYGLNDRFSLKFYSNNSSISYYNLNIFISIGLAFTIVGIVASYSLLSERKSFAKKIDKLIHGLQDFNYTYEIKETGIRYSSYEFSMDLRWSKFSGYFFNSDYLYLVIDNELATSLAISKSEISGKDFLDIFNYVKKKLPEINPTHL